MIEVRGLCVSRGGRSVLEDVSLRVAPGEFTAIVGRNGAGKSTLLHALAGGLPAARGAVTLDGEPLARVPPARRALRLAVLGQHLRLEFGFSAQDVVRLGRTPHPGRGDAPEDERVARDCLAAVGLLAHAERPYPELSGGEQQRVHLARVLAQATLPVGPPPHVLLDEPLAHQDLERQRDVLALLASRARAGAAVCAVLHDLNQAALADKVVVLADGRVLAQGPPAAVLTPACVRAAFNVAAEVREHPRDRRPMLFFA